MADLGVCLNIASVDVHVPEIEQCILAIKERVCSIYSSLIFKRMPTRGRFIAEIIHTAVYW